MKSGREFRLGVYDDGLRSLTLKAWRQGGDFYVNCREVKELKLSLHKSGKTRHAQQSADPRLALNFSHLDPLVPGRFTTVARAYFTTHDGWQSKKGATPRGLIALPPDECSCVTFGFTPHHPAARLSTMSLLHRATIELSDKKFVTITVQSGVLSEFLRIPESYTRHKLTNLLSISLPNEGYSELVDVVTTYQSPKMTYIYWIHHGVPRDGLQEVFRQHPVARAIGIEGPGIILNRPTDLSIGNMQVVGSDQPQRF